jgi:kynurenine formamidase
MEESVSDVLTLLAQLRETQVIDLSQTLEEHMPHFPTHAMFFHNLWSSYERGGRSLHYMLVMHEHNGTHVDAPIHFLRNAKPEAHVTIERVPLAQLMGRGVRVDCHGMKAGEYVSESRLREWESHHGPLQAGDIVVFDFGWAANWGLRPNDQGYLENWPGVGMDAAEYLLSKPVSAIGVDTLSPDPPEALRTRPIHPVVLEKQVLIVENLCNLGQLPDFFIFLALPLKIRQGSGSPIRAVALV